MENEINIYLSEIGETLKISVNENLYKNLENSLKKHIGINIKDILILNSNSQNLNLDILNNNNINDNNLYIYSLDNNYELYKRYFNEIFKTKNENFNFYVSNELIQTFNFNFNFNFNNNNNINNNNNKNNENNNNFNDNEIIINKLKIVLENFKNSHIQIQSNLKIIKYLLVNNISNITKSLYVFYKNFNIQTNVLKQNFSNFNFIYSETQKHLENLNNKFKTFIQFKLSLNSLKQKDFFEKIFNENKIKKTKENIFNQFKNLSEKIKDKEKKYENLLKNIYDLNLENNINKIIDNNELDLIKEKFNKFSEFISKYSKLKFENDLKQINNGLNLEKIEKEYENIINQSIFNNLLSDCEKLVFNFKDFISNNVLIKFFDYSNKIFNNINSINEINKKLKSYQNLLNNIEKEIYSFIFYINEINNFQFYYNEFERRICFLKNLKIKINFLKDDIKNENKNRNFYNQKLSEKNNNKLINDFTKNNNNNNIQIFFDWNEIKYNFDIYGDIYYNSINIYENEEEKNNNFNNNNKIIINENIDYNNRIFNLNKEIEKYSFIIKDLKEKIKLKEKTLEEFQNNFKKINYYFDEIKNNNNNIENNFNFQNTYLIKKTFFEYFTNILTIKNNEINTLNKKYNILFMNIEDYYSEINNKYIIDFFNIYKGTRNLFFKYNNNFYCVLLNNNNNNNLNETTNFIFKLDLIKNNIDKILLEKKIVFIIGIVNYIDNENYITLSKIDYIFEISNINNTNNNNNNNKEIYFNFIFN